MNLHLTVRLRSGVLAVCFGTNGSRMLESSGFLKTYAERRRLRFLFLPADARLQGPVAQLVRARA